MTWVSDTQLGDEVAKKLEVSSTWNDVGYLGLVSEGHPGGVEEEDTNTSRVLRALWWKGFRAGQRGLCRAGGLEKGVRKPNLLKKQGNPGVKKSFLGKPKIRGLMVCGSQVEGKPITENQGHHEGFPGGSSEQPMISTLSGEGSSHTSGNGQLERGRLMSRGEADRLERRKRGICFWYNKGDNRCKFGESCKFIHTRDEVVLKSFWCKYYVAGKECFAAENCQYSHGTAGVRCIQYYRTGNCRHGDE